MSLGIRPIIDEAIAAVLAEHPKYFTDKGHEHARTVIVRKVMAAIRGDAAPLSSAAAGTSSSAPESLKPISIDPKSREGQALTNLCILAGAIAPFRASDGRITLPPEANRPDVMAFAELAPKASWPFVTDRRAMGAWIEFFRETLPGRPKRPITEHIDGVLGIRVPWPFPPRKDGQIYEAAPASEDEDQLA